MRKTNEQGGARKTNWLVAASLTLALTMGVAALLSHATSAASPDAASAEALVGTWQATMPNGLRVGTIMVVPDGDGFAGTFVGYDYDRKIDPNKPLEGGPPKVRLRTASLLVEPKFDGSTLTFKLRPKIVPQPSAGVPNIEVACEMKLAGAGAAELKMKLGARPEPLVFKATRE